METEDQSGGYQAPAEFPGTPPNTPVIRCLECGNPFPAQAQFCGVCGHKLTVPPEQDSGTKLSSSLLPSSPADTPPQVPPVSRRTATVFLSYSHQDRDFVLQLHRDLQAQGIHVWIDHESIQLGTPDWEVAVRRAIREADAIVLAASPDARQSRIVKDELNVADMYRRPIYPIWVTGEQWMESIPLGWGYIQHIDARGTAYTSGVQQLAKVLLALPARRSGLLAGHSGDLELLFEPRNPYKGLSAFSTRDAQDFFGREQLIQEVIQDCTSLLPPEQPGNGNPRLMALIGPSGSGKSSLVMAGILPHFQAGGLPGSKQWIYLKPLRPGSSPLPALAELFFALLPARDYRSILTELEGEDARGLHRLAAALTVHPDTKVVLFVDQFEELFTQVKDEKERQRFINLLLTAATEPHGPLIVFLALRADFYRPVQYPELARLIQNHYRPVPLMELKDLRSVIEKPAMLPDVQVQFQGDLVGDMLFEVQGQVGSLPLLQFTLEQLFQRRHDRLLTEQAYREIGGVKGALSRRAEEIYQKLPSDEHRQIARDIFLRLFVPGSPELDATRRRAARSELKQADPGQEQLVQQTLETFISARFLTTNQVGGTTTVEVSHEALSREWKRLTEWLQEARGDIQVQQSLSSAVAEWEREKRPRDRLYRGTPLKQAREWARHNRPSEQEAAFIQAGVTRRVQSLLSGILIVLLLASSLGIAGWKVFFQPKPTLVTTYQDSGVGSLRWCIANASSGSTISFAQNMTGTIKLTGGDLVFSGDKILTISGPGANQLAVSGTNRGAIIHISKGATITLSGLSFKNGITNTNAFLFNEGTLTLTKSIISNNKTNALNTEAFGGGIENKGSLTVIDSIISNNTSIGPFNYGGGIYNAGQLIVNHSNISNNVIEGDISGGGGIWNSSTGTVTVTNHSIISNNVIRSGDTTGTHGGEGGGMFNAGKLTVTNSTFSNNQVISSSGVSFGGGIINVDTGTITVSSSIFSENTATSTTNNSLGGGIDNAGKLTVTNSTFSNNQATSSSGGSAGGGIFNFNKGTVMVNSSTFSENTTKSVTKNSQGGGIENEGKLTVTNSTFSNNQATSSTGNAFSGGINNFTSGTLVVTGSTFSKNIAKSDQHISQGGGITNDGKLTITNSTFSNNQAITNSGGSAGGGIFSISRDLKASFAIIRFCTIYENNSNIGGGIAIDPTGKNHMTLSSNIIAHNSANEGPDIVGTVISEGYNLIENVNGAKGLNAKTDRQVKLADLKIEPTLGNHGGPTQTLALLQGSQAIDVLPQQACSVTITDAFGHTMVITTDQRGDPRPDASENACDVGAYESSY